MLPVLEHPRVTVIVGTYFGTVRSLVYLQNNVSTTDNSRGYLNQRYSLLNYALDSVQPGFQHIPSRSIR
jgi:hypothetical protein